MKSSAGTRGIVYFVASLVGKEQYGHHYEKISKIFKDLGFEVWDDVNKVSAKEAREFSKDQITEYFSNVLKRIRQADIFVAEESHSSSAIGYEIGYAVGNNKPALVLREDTLSDPGAPLRGNPSKLLSLARYNEKTLKKQIEQFVKKAEKGMFVKRLPIEFTQNQVEYVEYRQRTDGKKKSFNATVREIIENARDNDADYLDSL